MFSKEKNIFLSVLIYNFLKIQPIDWSFQKENCKKKKWGSPIEKETFHRKASYSDKDVFV